MRFAVVLVLLLLVGCGSSPEPPSPPDPDPLPVPVTGPEPDRVTDDKEIEETLPKLPGNPSLTEKVLHEIRVETVSNAEFMARTSADCEGGKVSTEPNAITKCHVTYDDVTVPWRVTVDSGGDTALTVFYSTAPLKGLLLARAVHGSFWNGHQKDHEDLRCGDIPEISLVELGNDTGYRCQYAQRGPDGSLVRENVEVHLGDRGRVEFHVPMP
ncbi:hypothetical protein [Streptomyces sp. NPDC060275]|uniref:hypothetical protein n=1 Tax=Streptomyces sp. NPDC060275 TaxID=3347090 RepID=UPI003658FFEB